MLVIYRGSSSLLPLLACYIHLEDDADAIRDIEAVITNGWDWRAEPMKMMGKDKTGNMICCLVHGSYGSIYHRAIAGISQLFFLETKIVDIDTMIKERAGFYRWLATCLDGMSWSGSYGNYKRNKLISLMRPYIVLKAGDDY